MTIMTMASLMTLCSLFLFSVRGEDGDIVTCGSSVKLMHIDTKYHLHSHGIAYGSGSGQQSITTHGAKDDQGGLWILKEGQNLPICEAGQIIKCGDVIRLQHLHTGKNLHSHLFKSPLTNNQEVSGFGDNGEGDAGDNWQVVCKDGEKYWLRGEPVQFKHADTGKFLHSNGVQGKFGVKNCGQNCPIMGQNEVCTIAKKGDKNNFWKTGQGVYFPKSVPRQSIDPEL